MIGEIRRMLSDQYEATFCMLGAAIDRCPDSYWEARVVNLSYCQAMFHVLFFTDCYLGTDFEVVQTQPFHLNHAEDFEGYEELQNVVPQKRYDKAFLRSYLQHCRDKAQEVIAAATAESLERRPGFVGRDELSRLEVHIYNIRHIHHHAAQLGLFLRMQTDVGVPWVGSGWKDVSDAKR